jgi:hypothetical protein
MDGVFCCVLSLLSVLGQFWVQVVMTFELIIKDWASEFLSGTLYTDDDPIITTNGIITVADTLSLLIETTE